MEFDNVSRVEVIDHRDGTGLRINTEAGEFYTARVFQAHGCQIEVSLQDAGRTLKVFVSDKS